MIAPDYAFGHRGTGTASPAAPKGAAMRVKANRREKREKREKRVRKPESRCGDGSEDDSQASSCRCGGETDICLTGESLCAAVGDGSDVSVCVWRWKEETELGTQAEAKQTPHVFVFWVSFHRLCLLLTILSFCRSRDGIPG